MDIHKSSSLNQPAQTVHQLFESRVSDAPNSTALIFQGNKLTYNELNQQANRLANHLINAGLKKMN